MFLPDLMALHARRQTHDCDVRQFSHQKVSVVVEYPFQYPVIYLLVSEAQRTDVWGVPGLLYGLFGSEAPNSAGVKGNVNTL